MNLNKLSGCQLFQLLGQPVFLTFQCKNLPIYGNVYSIDPESRSVVLIQFKDKKILNFVIVPGDNIATINIINNLETKKTKIGFENICDVIEAQQIFICYDNKIRNEPEKLISKKEIHERYKNILNILKQRQVLYKEEIDITDNKKNKVIIVGAVRIVYPYLENNIISTNQNALKKIILLLKACFQE